MKTLPRAEVTVRPVVLRWGHGVARLAATVRAVQPGCLVHEASPATVEAAAVSVVVVAEVSAVVVVAAAVEEAAVEAAVDART